MFEKNEMMRWDSICPVDEIFLSLNCSLVFCYFIYNYYSAALSESSCTFQTSVMIILIIINQLRRKRFFKDYLFDFIVSLALNNWIDAMRLDRCDVTRGDVIIWTVDS